MKVPDENEPEICTQYLTSKQEVNIRWVNEQIDELAECKWPINIWKICNYMNNFKNEYQNKIGFLTIKLAKIKTKFW